MKKRMPAWLAAVLAGLPMAAAQVEGLAQVQGLVDPTRPPVSLAGKPGAGEDVPAGMLLQSVLISSGRRLAVINGNTVALGGMVGEARVVKITETEVVLRKGKEIEVLKMYPGVEKRPVKRAPVRQGGSK